MLKRIGSPLQAGDVQTYVVCEQLTEGLIYLMVLFSPWAFGTSQPWSIWVMNSAGYALGGMLAVKLAIRRWKGYRPERWEREKAENRKQKAESRGEKRSGNPKPETRNPKEAQSPKSEVRRQLEEEAEDRRRRSEIRHQKSEISRWRPTAVLAGLTVAILGYCLVSALNARATYQPASASFAYRDRFLGWLPHSFDSSRTWFAFWSYLGLACSFWAIRDWLLGKTEGEGRGNAETLKANGGGQRTEDGGRRTEDRGGEYFPARLRRLLWLLAINGGLLGLEGIIQRLEGSGKLLFLVRPHIHQTAATQFGPYAYYANAAQYFNLLWPVCLGFWWLLHRARGLKRQGHHVVLVCCAIMAACPIISTSRGGALVTVGLLLLATPVLLATRLPATAHGQPDKRTRLVTSGALALFFIGALALGFSLGWKALKPRMAMIHDGLRHREETYDLFRPMAADYPVFGTGPGTWESVSALYRTSMAAYWPAQLHNDWLETRITFGWAGSALIALALATVVLRWFGRGGIHGGRRFVLLTWLAQGGCLLHARFDFPFQMHSILFLFLVLCAVLFNLSRKG